MVLVCHKKEFPNDKCINVIRVQQKSCPIAWGWWINVSGECFLIACCSTGKHQKTILQLCLVSWSLNESEAGVGLLSIETFVLFLCK